VGEVKEMEPSEQLDIKSAAHILPAQHPSAPLQPR
jgi:hypothetical protein